MSSSDQSRAQQRSHYGWFMPITTRWMDNDIYGHINNVQYYSYFDTVANTFLIQQCGLDIHNGKTIGYIVHSQCHYKQGLAFPEELQGGFRVNRIGSSSIEYGLGIFKKDSTEAAAYGSFTHVFVDRESERPVPIPDAMREILTSMSGESF